MKTAGPRIWPVPSIRISTGLAADDSSTGRRRRIWVKIATRNAARDSRPIGSPISYLFRTADLRRGGREELAAGGDPTGSNAGQAYEGVPGPLTRAPAMRSAEAPPIPNIVIASKRETVLTEFPGQVTIVDGEDLTLGGVGGTEKTIQRVPTVSSTYLGGGRNRLFIRGTADSGFSRPTQSTVGQRSAAATGQSASSLRAYQRQPCEFGRGHDR